MEELEKTGRPSPTGKRRMWAAVACVLLLLTAGILMVFSRGGDFVVPDHIIICLDPGHGGTDPGAVWGNRLEKEDTLAMALAVKDALESCGFSDLTVMLTRDSDREVSLEQRADTANRAGATLFISIHRNSGGGRGVETWTSAQRTRHETQLAKGIQDRLAQAGISKDRGVKHGTAGSASASYYVVANTEMPACLVELGFLDSEEDNRLLEEHFDDYARAIAQGILEMVNKR